MSFRNLLYQSLLWRGIYFISVLLLNVGIARYFEAGGSGIIYFITNKFALVVTISGLSLEAGIAYYVLGGKVSPALMGNFAVVWSVLASVLSLLVMIFLFGGNALSGYGNYYLAAFCYTIGCMLVNFFTALFYANKNFFHPNLIMTAINLALLLVLPFASYSGKMQEWYLDVYFIGFLAQGCLLLLLYVLYFPGKWPRLLPGWSLLKPVFKYGLLAFVANLVFFLLYRADYWLVEKYCTTSDLGNYIQVSKLVQLFVLLPAMMASAVFPISTLKENSNIQMQIAFLSRGLILLYVVVCTILSLVGYWVFPLVFGSSFSKMYFLFLLLLPGILSLSIISLMGAYFAGRDRVRVNMYCSLLGLFVLITGDLLVLPVLGVYGAALISSLAYCSTLFSLLYFFMQKTNFKFSDFLFFKVSDMQNLRKVGFVEKLFKNTIR